MTTSEFQNINFIWARFFDCWAKSKVDVNDSFSPLTSKGYDVRKTSAAEFGLIDARSSKPNACTDYTLVRKLDKLKRKKIYDREIICFHNAPSTFKDFALQHYTRGVISGTNCVRHLKLNIWLVYLKSIIKNFINFLHLLITLATIKKCTEMKKHSSKKDFLPFLFFYFLKFICFSFGEFYTVFKFITGT
jgi:hypothetical protein